MLRNALVVFALSVFLCSSCTAEDPRQEESLPEFGRTQVNVIRPIVFRPHARMVEQDPVFETAESTPDSLTITTRAALSRPIAIGDVLAGRGESAPGYIRRVVEVLSQTATRIELRTEGANLEDIIESGRFEVVVAPTPGEMSQALSAPRSGGGGGVGGARSALRSPRFLRGGTRNFRCGGRAGSLQDQALDVETDIRFEDFDADFDLTMTYLWDFLPTGLEEFHLIFEGALILESKITSHANGLVYCELDLLGDAPALFESISIPPTMPYLAFSHTVRPRAFVEVSMVGELDSTVEYSTRLGFRSGMQYQDGEWSRVWEPDVSGTGDARGLSGQLSGQLRAEAGIEYSVKLWDTVGPVVALVGFAETDVKPAEDAVCTTELDVSWGAELVLEGEIQVPVVNLGSVAIDIGALELARQPLFHASLERPGCESECSVGHCSGSGESFDSQCCGQLICVLGDCVGPEGGREGDACECAGALSCQRVDSREAEPTCCARSEEFCASDSDCCGLMECGDDNQCVARQPGESCLPGDCVGVVLCDEVCQG